MAIGSTNKGNNSYYEPFKNKIDHLEPDLQVVTDLANSYKDTANQYLGFFINQSKEHRKNHGWFGKLRAEAMRKDLNKFIDKYDVMVKKGSIHKAVSSIDAYKKVVKKSKDELKKIVSTRTKRSRNDKHSLLFMINSHRDPQYQDTQDLL